MKKIRLGEILLSENKIDEAQLKSALAYQRRWGKKLGECLVDLHFISPQEMVQTLSRALRIPVIDVTRIDSSKITREILELISLPTARKHRVVPLAVKIIRSKKRLVIASSDPTNFSVFDEVQFKAGLPLLVMLAPDADIDWFVRKYYMNEGDVLPENYVSSISIIEDFEEGQKFEDPDKLPTDPISNIFFDEHFTNIRKDFRDKNKKTKK